MSSLPAIWLYGRAANRARAQGLAQRLAAPARALFLGPPGDPSPDLDLGLDPDLALALEACPPRLRPAALVYLDPAEDPPPLDLDCLPCPLLAWPPAGALPPGLTRPLPPGEDEAAREILSQAAQGRHFPWLARVQVNLPLRDLLGRFRPLVEGVEFHPEVGLDAQALDTLGPEDLEVARGLLAGRRVTAHLPFMDLSPGAADTAVGQVASLRLSVAAEWAVGLEARQAVAHLGYWWMIHRDLDAFARRLAEVLGPVAARLAEAGCDLVLENTMEPDPRPLLTAREATAARAGVPVGLCLDVGHVLAFSRTPLAAWWPAVAGHLAELHLHDNDGQDDRHQPPGRGLVDWGFLAREIPRLPRRPVLTLEPHSEPHFWGFLRGLEEVWGPGGLGESPRPPL
ncbi:MAG: sugar phosphate isomerase/epimerase [Deltaproteobacteria bacterium]|nr:sugar phosphate isomerase/epimerase [Deltaproteobacteria bacterium]